MILPKKRNYYIETVRSQYEHAHNKRDLDEVERIIAERYPEHSEAFTKVMNRTKLHILNMFAIKKGLFDEYCEWLFDILFKVEQNIISSGDHVEPRELGYYSEWLLNVWVRHQRLNVKYVPLYLPERPSIIKRIINKIHK